MAMEEEKANREGQNLLGPPTFKELDNGRFKCVETGHECPAKEMESYGQSKRCRLGLIDAALSKKKPPLNLFKQDPLSRSKLVCKLTGDTINKSEEHIWKHITGKRFLNKLEQKEAEKLTPNGTVKKKDEQVVAMDESKSNGDGVKDKKKKKKKKKTKKEKKREKEVSEIISEVRDPADKDSDAEDVDFWMPPVGSRWDFDDGEDRWDSGSDSGQESDEDGVDEEAASDGVEEEGASDGVEEEGATESGELSTRTKRMSIEIGPSSFASRKKKSKPDTDCVDEVDARIIQGCSPCRRSQYP